MLKTVSRSLCLSCHKKACTHLQFGTFAVLSAREHWPMESNQERILANQCIAKIEVLYVLGSTLKFKICYLLRDFFKVRNGFDAGTR